MKIKGPLLSLEAHGKFAQSIIYSKKKTGQIGRKYHYPKTEPSQKQLTQRTIIGLLTAHWQVMSAGDKASWNTLANAMRPPITGFNLWIKKSQTDLLTYHGLAGYWSMNEESGDTAFDYSGNGYHATLKPSYPSDSPQRVEGLNEKFGKALSLDGINNYVDIPYGVLDIDGLNPFTFCCWRKRLVTGSFGSVFGNFQDPAPRGFLIAEFKPGGYFYYILSYHDGESLTVRSTGAMPLNGEWYLLHATYNGSGNASGVNIYVNGKFMGRDIVRDDLAHSITNNSSKQIGRAPASTGYKAGGVWDDAKLYNRELFLPEIQKQYQLLRSGARRQPLLK